MDEVIVPWFVYLEGMPRGTPVQAADPLEALSAAGFPADEHDHLDMLVDGSYATRIFGRRIRMVPRRFRGRRFQGAVQHIAG